MTESVCTNIVGQTNQLETTKEPRRHWHFIQDGKSLSDMFLRHNNWLSNSNNTRHNKVQWFCYKHKLDNTHAMPKSQKILLCAMNEAV